MELDASATRFLLALLNAGVSAIGERKLLELVRGAVLWTLWTRGKTGLKFSMICDLYTNRHILEVKLKEIILHRGRFWKNLLISSYVWVS